MAKDRGWIKAKVEAQDKARLAEQETRTKQMAADAQRAKHVTATSYKAFAELVPAIKVNMGELNDAKAGTARFSIHTDDRNTLDLYRMGGVPDRWFDLKLDHSRGVFISNCLRTATDEAG